jgi:hypothetical protein
MTSQKQIRANRRNAKKSTGPKTEGGKARSKQNALKHGLRSSEIVTPDEDPADYEELRQELEKSLAPVGFVETVLVERVATHLWRLRRCVRIEACLLLGGPKVVEHNLAKAQKTSMKARSRQEELDLEESMEGLSESELYLRMIKHRATFYEESLEASDNPDQAPKKPNKKEYKDYAPEKVPFYGISDEELAEAYRKACKQEKQENPLTYDVGLAFSDAVSGADTLSKLARYEPTLDRALYRALQELQRLQAARKSDNVSAPAALDVNVNLGE